jgi:hypothetical protein
MTSAWWATSPILFGRLHVFKAIQEAAETARWKIEAKDGEGNVLLFHPWLQDFCYHFKR